MQLFLDADNTIADFNKRAEEILGIPPRAYEAQYGAKMFWKSIYAVKDFFLSLDPMPDAHELVDAVRHLNPIILTGKPQGNWAEAQKLAWRDKHFPDLHMIVCPSKDKIKHAKPGDVIVDDWAKHQQVWIDGGGIWVLHTSAADSIRQLRELGVI